MKLERTNNAKRNIFFGAIHKIVTMIFPFVIRVIIIRSIGENFLGLDSLFTSIFQLLNITELGFNGAVVYSMYQSVADEDYKTLSRLLNYFRGVYKKVGIAFMVGGLILLPFLPTFFTGSLPGNINVYLIYLLLLVNSSVGYWFFAYRQSLLEAYQRVDVVKLINTIVLLLVYILQIYVILVLRNYYLYTALNICGTIGNNICLYISTKKLFPQIECKGNLKQDEKKEIYTKIKGIFLGKICGLSRNSFDSIFISMFFGLQLTAKYSNYYQILNALAGFLYLINVSIQAGVGNAIVTENREKNFNDMMKFNRILMWISGWFTCCLLCLYQPFIFLAYGKNMLLPFGVVTLFGVYFYVLKCTDIISSYSAALGIWWELRYRVVGEVVANVILNYFLGKNFGVYGILIATIVTALIFNGTWNAKVIFKIYFGNNHFFKYMLFHLQAAIVSSFVCVISCVVCFLFTDINIKGFVVRLLICAFLPNILYFVIYVWSKDYRIAFLWLKNSVIKTKHL